MTDPKNGAPGPGVPGAPATGSPAPARGEGSITATAGVAISAGVADAKAAAAAIVPKLNSYLSSTVYASGYGLAFAFTFPAMFVAELLPSENVLMYGFKDGAAAAKRAVEQIAPAAPAPVPA
jgi:hypothetical protein